MSSEKKKNAMTATGKIVRRFDVIWHVQPHDRLFFFLFILSFYRFSFRKLITFSFVHCVYVIQNRRNELSFVADKRSNTGIFIMALSTTFKKYEQRRTYTHNTQFRQNTIYNQYLSAFNVVCVSIRHSGRTEHIPFYFNFFLFFCFIFSLFIFSLAQWRQCEEWGVWNRPWRQHESLHSLPNLI